MCTNRLQSPSLMELLAIRLSEQTTLAKSLVIPRRRESRQLTMFSAKRRQNPTAYLIKALDSRLRGNDGYRALK
jgi:hypothetical protein